MSNYKPYFRYIKDINLNMLFVFIVIIFVNTFTSVISITKTVYVDGVIDFLSQCTLIGSIACLALGVIYSLSLFNSIMSIKADRVGYLKAVFLWGTILAVGFALFGFGFDMLCKLILESWTKLPVKIYSNLPWIDMGSIQVATGTISRIINNMMMFSIGFGVGAIWYRLKVRTSILLFGVLPIASIVYIFNLGMRNPEKMNIFITNIGNMIANLTGNPLLFTGLKCLLVVVFSISGIMLLIKAPIKDYANDLL